MQEFIKYGAISFFAGSQLVNNGFTTMSAGNMSYKHGNESEVKQNHNFLACYVQQADVVEMQPEHGSLIVEVGNENRGQRIACDGFFTKSKGVVLACYPADCYPLVFTDALTFIMLLHVGWRGAKNKIIENAFEIACQSISVKSSNIICLVGPGIMECCYDPPIARELSKIKEWRPFVKKPRWKIFGKKKGKISKPSLDLLGFIRQQITLQGVLVQNIISADLCTACATSGVTGDYLFPSHCRSARFGLPDWRFMAYASLSP